MNLFEEISALNPELVAGRDYVAIATALSAGRRKVVARTGGIGLVLELLGPEVGAVLLDTLQAMTASVPSLKWAWYLIERGELDFGSAATRGMIDSLVTGGAMDINIGNALKAAAEIPDPVTADQVEIAMKNEDGSNK